MLLIRSTNHSTKYTNSDKKNNLKEFLIEYTKIIWWFVDYFWDNKIVWNNKTLDIKNNKLECPKFISTTNIKVPSELSARAIKLASSAALGIISSRIEKRKRQFYVLNKKQHLDDKVASAKIQSKIDSTPLTKPERINNKLFANLDSNCCDFQNEHNKKFDGFLELKSIWKTRRGFKIRIPIKFTKCSNKFKNNKWNLKTSWNISLDQVTARWEKDIAISVGNKIIGGDQGATTCLSLSDGQVTGKNNDGYDLSFIMKILSRKKKGSKAFKRAQCHRTNYINWSIKQLDFSNIKEFRLEKLFQVRKGRKISSFLGSWTYTQINEAIVNSCELLGVQVILQDSTYRSQRCSSCGWVQKSNRKRKEFICHACGEIHDADINGALNHVVDLYQLPTWIRQRKLNIAGFYWLETGIFNSFGRELTVPDEYKNALYSFI